MDKELKLSLWDESAETITENDFKEGEGPYIIIVTSKTIKAFQGNERQIVYECATFFIYEKNVYDKFFNVFYGLFF